MQLVQVAALKEKIHNDLQLGDPSLQKLIYGGKILKDDQTIAESKVKENGFIVAMIAKVCFSKERLSELGMMVTVMILL